MSGTVLFAAGGTGGHITPALATASALAAARDDLDVEFVGTSHGLEARLVPAAGWVLHTVDAAPLRRGSVRRNLRLPLVLARATRDARRLLRARRVVAACTFGGYVSGPLSAAARLARTPLVIHEQNAVPGLANRIAARWARAIAVSVPDTVDRFRRGTVTVTGNPVRTDLVGADLAALRGEAIAGFGLEPDRLTLLVFGGSLGARRINEALVAAADRWQDPAAVQILHVAGAREYEAVARAWEAQPAVTLRADSAGRTERARARGLLVRCVDFVERMDLAYAAADLVVCRAGASSIAELTVLGLPSVLVPYPHAVADEQTANARAVATAGGAVVVGDSDLDAETLAAACEEILLNPKQRTDMGAAARQLGHPDAAARLARLVADVADRSGQGATP